jgi:hypothetical protein
MVRPVATCQAVTNGLSCGVGSGVDTEAVFGRSVSNGSGDASFDDEVHAADITSIPSAAHAAARDLALIGVLSPLSLGRR